MPIRRKRRVASSRFSKRIVTATALATVVAAAIVTVLVTGVGTTTASSTLGGTASSEITANGATTAVASTGSENSSGAAIATTPISGAEKVYVSVVEATPQTSDDVNSGMTQSAVQTVIDKLNAYWSAQSNGAITIQLAGYETRSLGENTCAPNTALQSEETNAFGGLFKNDNWKGTHNHLLVLSAESCNADSFATVGGVGGEIFSGNGISASMGTEYLLHEFGHNLGFEHADASICTSNTNYDGATADFGFTSTVCPTREYDDYFDIMGYTVKNATPNLSSPQRIMAGWMSNYDTLTNSSASYTETVTALGSSGGTQALKIVDPISGDIYYVEYRTYSGLDKTSAEFNYGLQCDPKVDGYTICELDSNKATGVVRVLRVIPFASSNANGTTVLATGLTANSTDKTKRHTHLDKGDSFVSVDNGFSLKVLATNPSSGATIAVSFGTTYSSNTETGSTASSTSTKRVPSKTTIIAEKSAVTHGSKVVVSVTVKRSGTSTPTGTLTLYLDGKAVGSVALKATSKGVLKLTTPRLATAGTHTLKVAYSGPDNAKSSASTKVTAR